MGSFLRARGEAVSTNSFFLLFRSRFCFFTQLSFKSLFLKSRFFWRKSNERSQSLDEARSDLKSLIMSHLWNVSLTSVGSTYNSINIFLYFNSAVLLCNGGVNNWLVNLDDHLDDGKTFYRRWEKSNKQTFPKRVKFRGKAERQRVITLSVVCFNSVYWFFYHWIIFFFLFFIGECKWLPHKALHKTGSFRSAASGMNIFSVLSRESGKTWKEVNTKRNDRKHVTNDIFATKKLHLFFFAQMLWKFRFFLFSQLVRLSFCRSFEQK